MKDNAKKRNLNIGSVIQIVFIILKLTNLIHWSWVWVLSPLWISAIMTLILYIVIVLVCIIKKKEKK